MEWQNGGEHVPRRKIPQSAIASAVLGCLGLVTFGLLGILFIVALPMGIAALVYIKRSPDKLKGRWLAVSGVVTSIISAVLFALVVGIPIWWIVRGPIIVENADTCPYYKIPKKAKNISYYHQFLGPSYYYEFDMNEPDFVAWADAREIDVQRVHRGNPFEIYTYRSMKDGDPNALIVTDGYGYKYTEEDRGQYIAYDRARGRVYVYYHTR